MGEGTGLLQPAMQIGTEASEQVEGKSLVGTGSCKVEENLGNRLGLLRSLQGRHQGRLEEKAQETP